MTEELLVCAKVKNEKKFTGLMPLEELILALAEKLPVDKVFLQIEDEDGLGFRLREVGTLVVSFIPAGEEISVPVLPRIVPVEISVPTPTQEASVVRTHVRRRRRRSGGVSEPANEVLPSPQPPLDHSDGRNQKADFVNKDGDYRVRDELMEKAEAALPPPVKVKLEAPGPDSVIEREEDFEERWQRGLPTPPPRGEVKITGFRDATPEESARAAAKIWGDA